MDFPMFARMCLPVCLPDLFAKLFCPYLSGVVSGKQTFHDGGPPKQSIDPEVAKQFVQLRVLLIKRGLILAGGNLG